MNELHATILLSAIASIGTVLLGIYQVWSNRGVREAESHKITAQAYLEFVKGMGEMSKLVTTGNQERDGLIQRVNKMEDDLQDEREGKEKLAARVTELEGDLQKERSDKDKLAARVTELETTVSANETQIAESVKERDRLRADLETVKLDRAKFEAAKEVEVGNLLAKIEALEERIKAMEIENQALRARLSQYEPHESAESPLAVVVGAGEHSDSQEKAGENPVHN